MFNNTKYFILRNKMSIITLIIIYFGIFFILNFLFLKNNVYINKINNKTIIEFSLK